MLHNAVRRTIIGTWGAALLWAMLDTSSPAEAQLECPGDPTRTVFTGGPGTGDETPAGACRQFDDNPALCQQAFHLGGDGIASCYYDAEDDACRGCGPDENEEDGDCVNTCADPTCADPTRTEFLGGPGNEACRQHDGNETACLAAFHRNTTGGYSSCWYDSGSCLGCGPGFDYEDPEERGCTNTCVTSPVCVQDPERTIFAGGPGVGEDDPAGACRQFDDDMAMCNQAYHLGGDGIYSSCFPRVDCEPCGGNNRRASAPASGGGAQGIGPGDEVAGCINSCVPAPTCADMARTTFVGGPGTDACRSLDDDPSACNAAFHLGRAGVASCWYDEDNDACRGCGPNNETGQDCENTCVANICPLDPTRTVFAGGPGDGHGGGACRQFDMQATCEAAFHRGRDGVASCFWTGSECVGCNNSRNCINTCAPVPTCLDETRTNFVGGNGQSGGACHTYDGDETGCLTAYHESGPGFGASCWYDATEGECNGCGPRREDDGVCTNTCQPTPTCALDATRTVFAGGPGTDACETFDGDQPGCLQAFHRTPLGTFASCFYDASDDDCRGCGPVNESDGDCTNTCGPVPTCPSDPTRTFASCDGLDGNATACGAAFETTPDGPVSCVALPVCIGCGLFNQSDEECTNTCEDGPGSGTEVGLCDDGADNDADGAIDCGDADCAGEPACAAPAPAMSWPGLLVALLVMSAIAIYRLRTRSR